MSTWWWALALAAPEPTVSGRTAQILERVGMELVAKDRASAAAQWTEHLRTTGAPLPTAFVDQLMVADAVPSPDGSAVWLLNTAVDDVDCVVSMAMQRAPVVHLTHLPPVSRAAWLSIVGREGPCDQPLVSPTSTRPAPVLPHATVHRGLAADSWVVGSEGRTYHVNWSPGEVEGRVRRRLGGVVLEQDGEAFTVAADPWRIEGTGRKVHRDPEVAALLRSLLDDEQALADGLAVATQTRWWRVGCRESPSLTVHVEDGVGRPPADASPCVADAIAATRFPPGPPRDVAMHLARPDTSIVQPIRGFEQLVATLRIEGDPVRDIHGLDNDDYLVVALGSLLTITYDVEEPNACMLDALGYAMGDGPAPAESCLPQCPAGHAWDPTKLDASCGPVPGPSLAKTGSAYPALRMAAAQRAADEDGLSEAHRHLYDALWPRAVVVSEGLGKSSR